MSIIHIFLNYLLVIQTRSLIFNYNKLKVHEMRLIDITYIWQGLVQSVRNIGKFECSGLVGLNHGLTENWEFKARIGTSIIIIIKFYFKKDTLLLYIKNSLKSTKIYIAYVSRSITLNLDIAIKDQQRICDATGLCGA